MADTQLITETRELVALNADVVGYSRLMADDFGATTTTMERYHRLVEKEIAQAGGALVNFVGDNFMAVFEDAKAAIGAAIAISAAIERDSEQVPENRRLRFRMGIDQGPVTISDGDYFGDALNIAARIQALARPGGVSVSGSVYQELDEPALRFRSTGVRRLKNIPEGVEVFEFADLPTAVEHQAPRLALSPPSIAVLPIHTSGLTAATEGVPELIRADVVHRLAGVPSMSVIDAPADPIEPATQAPEYLMEMGFHQFEERARFYAKLMQVATMNIVTSQRWSATAEELVAGSDEIADQIAAAVEVELVIGEPAREYSRLEDPAAIRDIYQGWYHLTADTPEGILRAIELFEGVAAAHPDLFIGPSLTAFAHWVGAAEGLLPDAAEHYTIAMDLARRGAELGDQTGLAQMVQAAILMSIGQAGEALEMLEHVEIQRPTCDITYGLEASVRRYLGQWEKSIDLLDVAMRLTAMNKPWYPTIQACSLYIGNRLQAAASTAESVLEHQPRNLEALMVLAAAQVELGQLRRAKATAALITERFPGVDVGAWLDRRPYQDPELVTRWKRSLAEAGLDSGDRITEA